MDKIVDFQEALKILDIEDYAERILKSNSHGELSHLKQYILFAEIFKNDNRWFRGWFEKIVKSTEGEAQENIFQHILKIFSFQFGSYLSRDNNK